MRTFLVFFGAWWLLLGGALAAEPETLPSPRLLVITSYSPGYSWAERELDGLLTGLRAEWPGVNPMVESMNWRNDPTSENLESFKQRIQRRYGGKQFDALVTLDNAAFDFALHNRAELFPGVPLVFCGVNGFDPAWLEGQEKVTGVGERVDAKATVELMLRLHPRTRTVAVITDTSETGLALAPELAEQLAGFGDKIDVQRLHGLTAEKVAEELEKLPDDALVLHGGFSRDPDGRLVSPQFEARFFSERSPVPVYGLWDFHFGHGIVGGKIVSGRQHGEQVARLTARVVRGEMPQPEIVSPSRWSFDFKQLGRFGISIDELPPGSEIINLPASPWFRYRKEILWTLAAAALLVALNLALLANIRGRRRAERALRERERRFRALVENGNDLILTCNADRRVDYRSPAFASVLGFSASELESPRFNAIHPDDVSAADEWMKEAMATPGACVRPSTWLRVRHKDGSYRWLEAALRNLLHDPAVGRLVVNARDVTDRKLAELEREKLYESERQAREQAEAASRAKDEFLALVSHELRTPLTPIIGWTALMRSSEISPETRLKGLQSIERNARVQAGLVEQLLEVSRFISGKIRLAPGPVDLASVVRAAVDSLRPAAQAKQLHLVSKLPDEPLPAIGDAGRLQQLAWHLLSNAIKFTPAGGTVEIELGESAEGIRLCVRDTGQGIDPEQQPYLFRRFWQADMSVTRRFGGLGLGLALVRQLAELHGGSVEAHSEGVGKGAAFTLRLPGLDARRRAETLGSIRGAHASHSAPAGTLLRGLKILVVEDEPDTRELLGRALGRHGAQIELAAEAGEALELVRQAKPDLMVSDIGLPGVDGVMLLRTVRSLPNAEGGGIPAIALTGFADEERSAEIARAGFQLHLVKPVDTTDLAAAIARVARDAGVARLESAAP